MNNKTSAIIRLTISLLAVVLLTSLLIMGISGRSLFGLGNLSMNFGTKYSNADKYSAGNAKFPADDLKDIRINWIDGDVNVLPCDGNDIEIEETSENNLSEKEKVHYYYDNGTLYIQYEKSQTGFIFSITDNHKNNKSLTLRIPKTLCGSLSNFELDTASSQNNISDLSCSNMEIDTVSGDTILTDVEVTSEFDFDNVSGEINLQGMFSKLEIDTVSGVCFIDTDITPSAFNLDTVSGDCELMLPYSAEFCAEIDSASGDLNFNGFQTTKDDDTYICGNGNNEFDFDTVSGDITIIQKEQGNDDSQVSPDNQDNGSPQDGNQDNDDLQDDNGNQDNGSSQDDNDNQDNGSSQDGNGNQDNGSSQDDNQGYGYGSQNGNGNYGHGYQHHREDH